MGKRLRRYGNYASPGKKKHWLTGLEEKIVHPFVRLSYHTVY